MMPFRLHEIGTLDPDSKWINAIKYKYDETSGIFRLSPVLPETAD